MSQLLRRGHLTTGIAAQVLGLSQQHVITLCNQGVIQADRTKHARRITPFEVMRIQAARQQGATAQ